MLLGFQTGSFHKFMQPISREAVLLCKDMGCNVIELGCGRKESKRIFLLKNIRKSDLKDFIYKSIHAPTNIMYVNNRESIEILDIIEHEAERLRIKNVIFHPDSIKDWNIFKKYSFNIVIENMDIRNVVFKNVEDFKSIFNKYDFKMVLDLNHCYANDNSMDLAGNFIKNFGDRICEFHLSGFIDNSNIENLHHPLFKTKQKEIISSILNKRLPILIESVLHNKEDAEKEINFVRNNLKLSN